MLEGRLTLEQCEAKLDEAIGAVRLLGELPFSTEDVARLAAFARKRLATVEGREGFFGGSTPASLACLLVWTGALTYSDDGFWPHVHQLTGWGEGAWQGRWADNFFDYLYSKALPTFLVSGAAIDGGQHNVTPILLHAGIPTACLPDFFKRVLEPAVEGWLADLPAQGEIVASLDARRQQWNQGEQGPLAAVDRPVRRFLLYGGESANQFFAKAVRLICRARVGQPLEPAVAQLPKHVVKQFQYWWPVRNEPRQPRQRDGEEEGIVLRGLKLRLNPALSELGLFLPEQVLPAEAAHNLSLVVHAVGGLPQEQSYLLRAYGYEPGLAHTEEATLPLLSAARAYRVDLVANGRTLAQTSVEGPKGIIPYLAFSWRGGRALAPGALPRGRLWLMILADCTLANTDCIVAERGPLQEPWQDYVLHGLGLSCENELCLTRKGEIVALAVRASAEPITLEGGELVAGVTSEGACVYRGAPPRLRLPLDNENELSLWRLALRGPSGEHNYHLDEFVDVVVLDDEDDCACLPLGHGCLLGDAPCGRFRLEILKNDVSIWQRELVALPQLEVRFSRSIYGPLDEAHLEQVNAAVLLPPGSSLRVDRPATSEGNRATGVYHLTASTDCQDVHVELRLPGAQAQVRLTIALPKIAWCVQDGGMLASESRWHVAVKELWVGELKRLPDPCLLLHLPLAAAQQATLQIEPGPSPVLTRQPESGFVAFRLAPFADALRTGPPVSTFILWAQASQQHYGPIPLCTVRTRWEVHGLECQQHLAQGRVLLKLSWQEKGETDGRDRFIRLWRQGAEHPISEKTLPHGVLTTELVHNVTTLPPGDYSLQFALDDPWGQDALPGATVASTFRIHVFAEQELWQGRMVTLVGVALRNGAINPIRSSIYRIELTGRIRTTTTESNLGAGSCEKWFQGYFQPYPDYPDVTQEINYANPMEFNYDPERGVATQILGRNGEHAMYCVMCTRLYWTPAKLERERRYNHPLLGPINRFVFRHEPANIAGH